MMMSFSKIKIKTILQILRLKIIDRNNTIFTRRIKLTQLSSNKSPLMSLTSFVI